MSKDYYFVTTKMHIVNLLNLIFSLSSVEYGIRRFESKLPRHRLGVASTSQLRA